MGEALKPPRKSEQRQRTALVSVRLLPAELEIVQALAAAAGFPMSVSGYLRDLALSQVARPGKGGSEEERGSGP